MRSGVFAAVVYSCTLNPRHVIYIEPELAPLPSSLFSCPWKDAGVMEMKHGIELDITEARDTGMGPLRRSGG